MSISLRHFHIYLQSFNVYLDPSHVYTFQAFKLLKYTITTACWLH